MKTKGHILVLFAVLLCLGMIVSPISAYTTLLDVTEPNSTEKYYGETMSLFFDNWTTSKNAGTSRVVHEDFWCYVDNDPTSWTGTVNSAITYSGATKGNITLNYNWGSVKQNWNNKCTLEVLINDMSGTPAIIEHVALSAPSFTKAAMGNQIVRFKGGQTHQYDTYGVAFQGYSQFTPGGRMLVQSGTAVTAPEASFTCSPVSQYPNQDVVCTDTSTNTPTDWLWTLDYPALGIETWQSSTSRNFTWQSAYTGLFDVNLYASNSAGGSWYNRSEYVEISLNASPITPETPIPPGYIRSAAQCVDSQTSATVRSCQISLLDKEAGVWSNGSWYGTYYIDTLPAHHIDAYGSAAGYTSTSRLNLPASSSIMYELFMIPGYVPPASDGNVWLYVIANDLQSGAPLSGAQVQVSSSGSTTLTRFTSSLGQASLQWPNNTVAHITVSQPGYQSSTEVITTSSAGPDTVRIELQRLTVTPTVTGTVLPGELTPRPTIDPNDPSITGNTNAKGQEIMNWIAMNGFDLVQLCFMVTILGLLGIKLGK